MQFSARIIGIVVAVVVLLFGAMAAGSLVEVLDAHELMVIQSIGGDLACYTDPGPKWQGFGKVTKYPRRAIYAFDRKGKSDDTSKKLRFNDGGHASLYGAVSWEMPLACPEIIAIHKTFGSAEGVESAAIAKMIDAAVYLAGPLMSSTESSGERRAELVQYINDQAENGVYVTRVVDKTIDDPITKEKKTVTATEIVRDEKGMPRRQQGSILGEFHLKLLPLSISELAYDAIVEDQIKQRQAANTQVQISVAKAKQAEQEKVTAEANGAKDAAVAKWKQLTIKEQAVTEAQQKLAVAELAAKEAEQWKREQILRGEGEAQRKQLVMSADGALDAKLEALVRINEAYADAIKVAQPGAWSPVIVMGGGEGKSGASNAAALIDLLSAKTARDIALDMSIGGKAATSSLQAAKR